MPTTDKADQARSKKKLVLLGVLSNQSSIPTLLKPLHLIESQARRSRLGIKAK
jgi:hypothetical protein